MSQTIIKDAFYKVQGMLRNSNFVFQKTENLNSSVSKLRNEHLNQLISIQNSLRYDVKGFYSFF